MKKILSFLMLLSLLPLAGWAADGTIFIRLATIRATYDGTDLSEAANFTVNSFTEDGPLPEGVTKDDIVKAADIHVYTTSGTPLTEAINAGSYQYNVTGTVVSSTDGTSTYDIQTYGNSNFNITPRDINDVTINDVQEVTYTGEALTPTFTIAFGDKSLEEDKDYTVEYSSNVDAPSGDIVLHGIGNYTGTKEQTFKIGQKDIEGVTITIPDVTYNGEAQKPAFTVKDGDKTLDSSNYAFVEYTDNTNAGTAKVTLTGTSNYQGEISKTFQIKKAPLTVKANDQKKSYAYPDDRIEFTAEVDSLKGNDTFESVFGDAIKYTREEGEDAGTYAITVSGPAETTNYTVTYQPGTLTIGQRGIDSNILLSAIEDQTYTGKAIEPGVTLTFANPTLQGVAGKETLTADKDYDVTYEKNVNVGEASVTITGKGNIKGTKTATFKIKKAPLTIAFDNASKAYGADAPEFSVTYGSEGASFVGDDTKDDLEGTLTLTTAQGQDAASLNEAGTYTITPGGLTSENYDITFVPGTYTIGKATLTIVVDTAYTTYGVKENPKYTYHVEGLANGDTESVITKAPVINRVEDGVNAGEYKLEASGAEATSYAIQYQPGVLKIEPMPVTVTADKQFTRYAEDIQPASADNVDVKFPDGIYRFPYNDKLDTLNLVLSYNADSVKVGDNKGAIKVSQSVENPNYVVTFVAGDLDIAKPYYLSLNSDDNDYKLIQAYNNITVDNVYVKFNREQALPAGTEHTWKAEKWNTLVLPFDVTVRELSNAFGYAVVNVVNPQATTDGNVNFTLTMGTIPANTPFLIKTDEDLENCLTEHNNILIFGQHTIIAPETEYPSVDAGNGYKLVGAYKTHIIDKESNGKELFLRGDNDRFAYIGGSSKNSWTITPLSAYVDQSGSASAKALTFVMQNPDGSTTALQATDVDGSTTAIDAIENGKKQAVDNEGWYNLNGVKLNAAPVQKGVYIHNGKKVVVK